jgi:hypothetical protein
LFKETRDGSIGFSSQIMPQTKDIQRRRADLKAICHVSWINFRLIKTVSKDVKRLEGTVNRSRVDSRTE